jgi:hypothetical protein
MAGGLGGVTIHWNGTLWIPEFSINILAPILVATILSFLLGRVKLRKGYFSIH